MTLKFVWILCGFLVSVSSVFSLKCYLSTCFDHGWGKICTLPYKQECHSSQQCRTLSYDRGNVANELRSCSASKECNQEYCQGLDGVSDCTVTCCNTELCNPIQGREETCFGDSCYEFSDSGSSWKANRETCKGLATGGDLVSMETEEEWSYINSQMQKLDIPGDDEWHIGLKKGRQGDWIWVSGSELTISKWQTTAGEPSGDGPVAVMAKNHPPGTQGLFNDLRKSLDRAFICELPKDQEKDQKSPEKTYKSAKRTSRIKKKHH